jgi:hypothetical protein
MGVRALSLLAAVIAFLVAGPATGAPTSASNKAAARVDAAAHLAAVALPPGVASSATEPAGDRGQLEAGSVFNAETAHAWWTVSGSVGSVYAYVRAHVPAGATYTGGTLSGTTYQAADFNWPAINGVLGQRELDVSIAALPKGRVGILAQADSVWIVPRPPGERVPEAARVLSVTSAKLGGATTLAQNVVRRPAVTKLAALLNAMPVVQPGAYSCPALVLKGARKITLVFRARSAGPQLAKAVYIAYGGELAKDSGPCNAIDFWVGTRRERPLIGGRFLSRAQRILGFSLTR